MYKNIIKKFMNLALIPTLSLATFGCIENRVSENHQGSLNEDIPLFDFDNKMNVIEGQIFQETYSAENASFYSIDTELNESLFEFLEDSGRLTVFTTDDVDVGSYWTRITAFQLEGNNNKSDLVFPLFIDNVPERATSLIPLSLESAVLGEEYEATITAEGDPDPNYESTKFEMTDGTLPEGITIDETGLISGIPEEYGVFSFSLRARGAEDPADIFLQRGYSLNVEDPGVLFSVRVRNAYDGSYIPQFLEGIDVSIELENGNTYNEITDSDGISDFILPTNTFLDSDTVNASLAVRDDLIFGSGPNGDCTSVPYGLTIDECIGDFLDYEKEIEITNSLLSPFEEVWMIENYDVSYPNYNSFYKYFKAKTSTNYSSSLYFRWDQFGSLSAFPLLVYIPEHEFEGVNFQDQIIAAAEEWNNNPQGITYFDVTTDPAFATSADIRTTYDYSSTSNILLYADSHHLINYSYMRIENDLNLDTLVLHEATQQLGRALGHRQVTYGATSSVFGDALYPNDLDEKFVQIVSTHPEQSSRVHRPN